MGQSKGDRGKACAVLASVDNHVLVAFKYGLVEKYSELGRRLWGTRVAAQVRVCVVLCLWCVSTHVH